MKIRLVHSDGRHTDLNVSDAVIDCGVLLYEGASKKPSSQGEQKDTDRGYYVYASNARVPLPHFMQTSCYTATHLTAEVV